MDEHAIECVRECSKLSYEGFEIVLLPDSRTDLVGVKVVPTGPVLPGRKRNIGLTVAKGDILAYIDADAYPRRDWLTNAVRHLQDDRVGAVGGPAVTAPTDSSLCQAQGLVLSSFMMGGSLSARYKESGVSEADDIHSVNFAAWKRVIEEVGGWNEKFWPGEDTLICLEIHKAGYRQLLASDVVVYHHRRPRLDQFLRQIGSFGVHRAFFAKLFPENSRRVGYFIPSLILLAIMLGPIISFVLPSIWSVYLGGLFLYLTLVSVAAIRSGRNRLAVFIMIPLTHLAYGAGFIRGLVARGLPR